MVKFPGGTPGRWEKIAQELGRSVPAVSLKLFPEEIAGPRVQGKLVLDQYGFWSKPICGGFGSRCVADLNRFSYCR